MFNTNKYFIVPIEVVKEEYFKEDSAVAIVSSDKVLTSKLSTQRKSLDDTQMIVECGDKESLELFTKIANTAYSHEEILAFLQDNKEWNLETLGPAVVDEKVV